MEIPRLHSEVFLRNDIAAILQAIAVTATIAGGDSPEFRRGFAACLYAVATALHIEPDGPSLDIRRLGR